jgi:toxin ParE1/3/4
VSRRLLRTPRADRDVEEALAYLLREAGQSPARRFLAGLEETYDLVLAHPEAGRLYSSDHPALSELRVFRVRRFDRYLVFYESSDEVVRVIRVLHGSRDLWTILGLTD